MNEALSLIHKYFPDAQAVYLFGSYSTQFQRNDSDVDLAILLPPLQAKTLGNLVAPACLEDIIGVMNRNVDLINLRMVDTVFQHLIIQTGRVLSDIDPFERASFEILVMGKYQKLNQEHSEILAVIQKTGTVFLS